MTCRGATFALCLALIGGPAAAQPAGEPAPAPAGQRVLPDGTDEAAPPDPGPTGAPGPATIEPHRDDGDLTYDAAVAQGYAPRPEDEVNGSLAASLLALGPGFVVRGAGHFYLDENRSGLILLFTELTAILLIASGLIASAATDGSAPVVAATDALTHAGVILFVGSWVADIIGSFTGTVPFDRDSTRVTGSVFGIAYRYTDSPLDAFRHHLVARLSLDAGWFYLRPLIDLEAGLAAREGEVDLGVRVLRGDDPHEHLALGVIGRRRENKPDGFAVSGLMGYAWAKADLGRFMSTLRHVYLASRVAYGFDGYQFTRADSVPSFFADVEFTDTRLLLQSGLGFNTGENTHMLVLWSQDTIGDIPPAPTTGQYEIGLQHRYQETVDIDVKLTLGDGFAVWLGLGYAL